MDRSSLFAARSPTTLIHPIHPQWYLNNSLSLSLSLPISTSPSAFTDTQSTNAALPLLKKTKFPYVSYRKRGKRVESPKKRIDDKFPYHGISSCCLSPLLLSSPPISDLP